MKLKTLKFINKEENEKMVALFLLNDENIEIELIGLCTDICVVSNALILKANFPETTINVIADCCAGVTPDAHKSALTAMKSCQINII